MTDPACSLAPSHSIVTAVRDVELAVAHPMTGTSFVQLQKVNADFWRYRKDPESANRS